MQNDRDIKFWLPANIQKATDLNGNEIMRLGGIASTIDEDTDGESLDPSGFDVKPLLSKGVVNWHHQVKGQPKTIIGEPTKAEIRKDGLYLETDLYPSSQIARDVWELAKTFEKDSKTRHLGYSIEGKVIKRKSNDKKSPDYKKILKAVITGVAVTHQPKNSNTFASIIKGEGVDVEDLDEVEDVEEVEETNKKEIKKELNTTNAAPLKRESVDGELKVSLSKAEVLDKLFKDIPNLSIEKGEKIYKLISKIGSMKKPKVITDADIEKAYEALELDVVEKASSEADDKSGEKETTETVENEEVVETQKSETDNDIIKAFESAINGFNVEFKESNQQTNQLIKAVGILVKDTKNTIEKANDALDKANDALEKAETRENELLEIVKAQTEELSLLKAEIQDFGDITPPAKSLRSSNVIERSFEKSEEDEKVKPNTFSISKQKTEIVELLDQASFAKGYDKDFGKACTTFESSGVLPTQIIERMKKEYNINIVK